MITDKTAYDLARLAEQHTPQPDIAALGLERLAVRAWGAYRGNRDGLSPWDDLTEGERSVWRNTVLSIVADVLGSVSNVLQQAPGRAPDAPRNNRHARRAMAKEQRKKK